MKVKLSGISYGWLEGSGLFQTDRPDLLEAFRSRRHGFGYIYEAEMTAEDALEVYYCAKSYGEFGASESGPGADPTLYRDGMACLRDADRLAKTLRAAGVDVG